MIKPQKAGNMKKDIEFSKQVGYNTNPDDSQFQSRNSLSSDGVPINYAIPATPIVGRITPTNTLIITVNGQQYFIDAQLYTTS